MSRDKEHYKELLIFKTIAENLNQSSDMKQMLQTTLEKLLELTNLKAGWIFLVDDEPHYQLMADHNLPPALSRDDKEPMRCSDCLCLRMCWAGKLNEAVNIIECERLHNAVQYSWGETHNLTHHATIPITIRGEHLGLLNVGSPGKEHFSEEELALLQSIAYQIGTAVERTRLYEQREKQAVDEISRYIMNYYADANQVTRYLWKINDRNKLLTAIVKDIGTHFGWPTVALIMKQDGERRLRAFYHKGETRLTDEPFSLHENNEAKDMVDEAFQRHQASLSEGETHFLPLQVKHPFSVALPLNICESMLEYGTTGVLFIGRDSGAFSQLEIEILEVMADHVSLSLEKVRLYDEWQDLLLAEERNRLARDLHDSVNQKLFSLSLMARGVNEMTKETHPQTAEALKDIGQLAQESLTEMRTLIWQLRPNGGMKGMLGSLKDYADKMGIRLTILMKEVLPLADQVEEVLWRIGQEALNNISKHAQTNRAWIRIEREGTVVRMKISDQGKGFVPEQAEKQSQSLGIISMRERAAEMNGSLSISSEVGVGTLIMVTISIPAEEEA